MKSTYEKWIEANQKLNSCMEGIADDKYSAYSPAEQNATCLKEKLEVGSYLKNNSISFKFLLQERLQATGANHS